MFDPDRVHQFVSNYIKTNYNTEIGPSSQHNANGFHNFASIHQSLRVTPAMEAGVSDHVWELSEIIALIDSTDKAAA
jgi:hypothetical protein